MDESKIKEVADLLRRQSNLSVLTGAGISAESGVPTFRGPDGLWRQFRAEDLATPEAFSRDPRLVWEWYDWRRQKIKPLEPNPAHYFLAKWERKIPSFVLLTQNIDGLHQKAGSTKLLELHGNIWQVRCVKEGIVMENKEVPLPTLPPTCPSCGSLLRPHVVWFGEALPRDILEAAFEASANCTMMLVIGTSAVVQPAASLPQVAANRGAIIIEINPEPTPLTYSVDFFLQGKAGEILPLLDKFMEEEKINAEGKK